VSRRSLRARLTLAAVLSVALALIVAAVGLVALFERHVERRIGQELDAQLAQLAAAVQIAEDGAVLVDPPLPDPRLNQPLGGLYWQVDDERDGRRVIGAVRSRSLWDRPLRLPPDQPSAGVIHAHRLPGPDGRPLLVRERRILLQGGGADHALRLMTAMDAAELTRARHAFATDMLPYLGLIALVLGLATLVQIRAGLAPLEAVRRGVGAIRSGRAGRLADDYPDEVMPLVAEVNALLAAREQAIERARAWTADLAHGLKTPLAALAADAGRLRQTGNAALADDLEQLAEVMRRRVDRELVRARVRSGAETRQARADVVDACKRLLRTLRRTPMGERVDWRLDAPAQAAAALMPDDLMELLGNLLENAAKWATERVEIHIEASDGAPVRLQIADDGPGVPDAELPRLGERGLRLDLRKDGSGLGLAIVRDVIDAYGGRLAFSRADGGGLLVQIELPVAG
jgi:signal transduction histidine kinase